MWLRLLEARVRPSEVCYCSLQSASPIRIQLPETSQLVHHEPALHRRNKLLHRLHDEVQHLGRQPRIDTNPEDLIHHKISIYEFAHHSVLPSLVRWLPQQIPSEEKPRSNLLCFQCLGQIVTCKRSL